MDGPLAVRGWPQEASAVWQDLRSGLAVISVSTPDSPIRHVARERIRAALQDVLGIVLDRPAASVVLVSQPGQPLRVDLPGVRIGLSVSHVAGLSIAGLYIGGAVGVDLMRVPRGDDWMPDWASVARDYLGPQALDRIASVPLQQRLHVFAKEWTRHEASLKCLDMALTEWTPALSRRLASCVVRPLLLPDDLIASIAIKNE